MCEDWYIGEESGGECEEIFCIVYGEEIIGKS